MVVGYLEQSIRLGDLGMEATIPDFSSFSGMASYFQSVRYFSMWIFSLWVAHTTSIMGLVFIYPTHHFFVYAP
jgi:hypothetical protein